MLALAGFALGILAVALYARLKGTGASEIDGVFFHGHPQPMWIYDIETLQFLDVNAAARQKYGYSREEFLSMRLPDISCAPETAIRDLISGLPRERSGVRDWPHRHRDGTIVESEITSHALRYQGKRARLVLAADVTERVRAEERLRESEAALARAQQIAHLGSFYHDLRNGERIWSTQMYRIYGLQAGDALPEGGLWPYDHPDDAARINDAIAQARRARSSYDIDHRIIRKDGTIRYVQEQGQWEYDNNGKEVVNVGTVLDITERKVAERDLEHLAYHDSLTDLPNRTKLISDLQVLIDQSASDSMIALLFLDLDRFKIINDTLGHRFGDSVLVEIGKRLRERLPASGIVARPGGDEFIVVLSNMPDKLEVSRIADQILDALKKPFSVAGHEHFISASIGVSMYPLDGRAVEVLLQAADAAMYAAKQRGGGNFHFYTSNLQYAAARRFRLESALHRAMERGEFMLHYQPVLSVATGKIVAAEALIRWNDPETGVVMPSDFVPFAEETGLVVPLGDWVFKEACVQAKLWSAAGYPIRIWVNVSAPQLQHPGFAASIRERLILTGLNPALIGLELTERTFLSATEETIAAMHELKGTGVSLSLDDFGVAYSSLEYLRRLPIDSIKIDRMFLRDIATDRFNQSIVRAIVGISHDLNLQVTAEGVETTDQFAFLTDLGCDEWQGYYYGEAIPVDSFARLLRAPRGQLEQAPNYSGRFVV
ncbi:MAG: EAL domain-containing protein [Candidatus Eremiobacteraeota bacterium]|nr:EAL domain-containing protein [Candidatus Eremiobacteraeota bacterium]